MKKGALQHKILLILLGGITLSMSSSPRTHYRIYRLLARALNENKELDEWSEDKVRQSLYHINKNEYITKSITQKSDGEFRIKFEPTIKGKEVLKKYNKKRVVGNILIPAPAKWDGKWRFVVFDIPEKYHVARDVLREKLKRMNFFRIQQSVWAHPYPCRREIELLAEYYSLADKIFVFEDVLAHDAKLCSYFKRKDISFYNAYKRWERRA